MTRFERPAKFIWLLLFRASFQSQIDRTPKPQLFVVVTDDMTHVELSKEGRLGDCSGYVLVLGEFSWLEKSVIFTASSCICGFKQGALEKLSFI